MTLLLILTPTSSSKVSHSVVICVFHELVKRSTISVIKSKQSALSNLRVIINALCELEDNGFKNDHPLSIPLPSMNSIKFYRQYSHKSLPDFPGRCDVALGRHTNDFFHCDCHLLSFVVPPYKWSPGLWCTQSW